MSVVNFISHLPPVQTEKKHENRQLRIHIHNLTQICALKLLLSQLLSKGKSFENSPDIIWWFGIRILIPVKLPIILVLLLKT